MYADRHQSGKVSPGSLSLSMGIVGGLIAAGMLTSTVIAPPPPDRILDTYTVRPTPPPPPEPVPEPETATRVEPTPTAPDPIVVPPTPPTEPWVARPDPGPVFDTGTIEGTRTAVIDPPKPPPPVLTSADVDGRYRGVFQPIYPAAEQRAGNEGVVTLRVLIGVDGRVKQLERLASPSDAFWRATEQRALSKWRFTPATRDGVPFESWKTMTVRFRISEA